MESAVSTKYSEVLVDVTEALIPGLCEIADFDDFMSWPPIGILHHVLDVFFSQSPEPGDASKGQSSIMWCQCQCCDLPNKVKCFSLYKCCKKLVTQCWVLPEKLPEHPGRHALERTSATIEASHAFPLVSALCCNHHNRRIPRYTVLHGKWYVLCHVMLLKLQQQITTTVL